MPTQMLNFSHDYVRNCTATDDMRLHLFGPSSPHYVGAGSGDMGMHDFESKHWRHGSSCTHDADGDVTGQMGPCLALHDGDRDMTGQMGLCLVEGRNQSPGSSSPLSSTSSSTTTDTTHGEWRHRHVTSAASECSAVDNEDNEVVDDSKDDWCAEDWKLETEILMAECNLLRVEKELALRKCKQGCVVMNTEQDLSITMGSKEGKSDHGASGSRSPPDSCEDQREGDENIHGMTYYSSRFAWEALKRLQDLSINSSCNMTHIDPTDTLQDRLQNLLLAARVSAVEHTPLELEFPKSWDTMDGLGVGCGSRHCARKTVRKDRRCAVEQNAALRKQLELMSLELAQTKIALASRNKCSRRDIRPLIRRYSQQTLAEEMYCKAAIRQIVAQVQAETEEWSQMQGILQNLQCEMEGLTESQKRWEKQALQAEAQLLSLQEEVHDWRCRAQSAEEEAALLLSEKQILKSKIDLMEEVQKNMSGVVPEEEEKPRPASVGSQQEDLTLCESFVHSRNESGRSSVDLGTSSQRSFRKSIKKVLEFTNNADDEKTSKFWDKNTSHLLTSTEFQSKRIDTSSKVRHKNQKLNNNPLNVDYTKSDSIEPTCGHGHKERKKARLFAFKENRPSNNTSANASIPFLAENLQDGLLGCVISTEPDYIDEWFSSKPKSSLPSAPTTTPSKLPFGDILNIGRNRVY